MCLPSRRCGFDPWVRKIPWRRAWQPTTVFLPGESHGQRCWVSYCPYGHKELDTNEVTEHTLQQCIYDQGHILYIHLMCVNHPQNSSSLNLFLNKNCYAAAAAKLFQLCLTLCDPMDRSLPGSHVHGILQARILEWVAMSSFRKSSWPRDQTCIPCIDRWVLYHWNTREAKDIICIAIITLKEGRKLGSKVSICHWN